MEPCSCQFLHEHYPQLTHVAVGKPGTHDELVKDVSVFSGEKATEVLGIQYRPYEETFAEMTKSLERFEWKA